MSIEMILVIIGAVYLVASIIFWWILNKYGGGEGEPWYADIHPAKAAFWFVVFSLLWPILVIFLVRVKPPKITDGDVEDREEPNNNFPPPTESEPI